MMADLNRTATEQMSGITVSTIIRRIHDNAGDAGLMARGNSMRPFIHEGDMLRIRPLRSHEPEVGDIVAFIQSDTGLFVVHRVVKKSGYNFLVKGDNVSGVIDCVTKDEMVGKIIKIGTNSNRLQVSGLGKYKKIIAFLSKTDIVKRIMAFKLHC